jgi:hypothetical protein
MHLNSKVQVTQKTCCTVCMLKSINVKRVNKHKIHTAETTLSATLSQSLSHALQALACLTHSQALSIQVASVTISEVCVSQACGLVQLVSPRSL